MPRSLPAALLYPRSMHRSDSCSVCVAVFHVATRPRSPQPLRRQQCVPGPHPQVTPAAGHPHRRRRAAAAVDAEAQEAPRGGRGVPGSAPRRDLGVPAAPAGQLGRVCGAAVSWCARVCAPAGRTVRPPTLVLLQPCDVRLAHGAAALPPRAAPLCTTHALHSILHLRKETARHGAPPFSHPSD